MPHHLRRLEAEVRLVHPVRRLEAQVPVISLPGCTILLSHGLTEDPGGAH